MRIIRKLLFFSQACIKVHSVLSKPFKLLNVTLHLYTCCLSSLKDAFLLNLYSCGVTSQQICTGRFLWFLFYSFQCWIFKAGIFSAALVKVGLGDAVKARFIPPPAAQAVFTRTTSLFLSPEKLSVLMSKKAVACEYLINIVKRAGCISVLYAVGVIFG